MGPLLGYWWPMDGTGVVGCDLTAICSKGRNPVLAHAFVNHLLATRTALDNFSWNGYQPPVADAVPEAFADPSFPWHDLVPANLRCALLSPEEFARSRMLHRLTPSADDAWRRTWARVTAAA
jgi:spermidine/putrescine transport system substrate-binding protein